MLLNSKSKKSNSSKKKTKIFKNFNQTLLYLIFFLVLPLCTFSTFSLLFTIFTENDAASNPTSIPWIDNQSDCLHTRRTWKDNKCWDEEHSPDF